jgi:oligopeptide/dipeptide ABC transporter ATP-binding protein
MMNPLLSVKDLRIDFNSDFGNREVTDGISFQVDRGEILGIVGESGCGKSVTSLAVMGLLDINGYIRKGEILFEGKDLLKLSENELDRIRGKDICMVYQDALASLDPVFTIGNQMIETIQSHVEKNRHKAADIAADYLGRAGLPDPKEAMKKYPYELSGGMRQRVMIAMALSCQPKLLIADEPTTALDVTIQAQIMDVIRQIRKDTGMSMILITHDIGLMAQTADRVMVMYAGQIVEEANVRELFHHPIHPYTKALLASAPGIDDGTDRKLYSIKGSVPENYTDIDGCRFQSRCPFAGTGCEKHQEYKEWKPAHYSRCFKSREEN